MKFKLHENNISPFQVDDSEIPDHKKVKIKKVKLKISPKKELVDDKIAALEQLINDQNIEIDKLKNKNK